MIFQILKFANELEYYIRRIGVILKSTFPRPTISQGLFGGTDKNNNDRMNKMDAWLREVMINPIVMTIPQANKLIYDFFQVADS